MVEAAGDQANRDIVLAQAAHAIFADQPTGFAKTDTSDGRSAPLVSLSNRGVVPRQSASGSENGCLDIARAGHALPPASRRGFVEAASGRLP